MYNPIIEVFMDEMKMQHENKILKAVQNVGVFVDKDELLKALAYDRRQYEKGFADGVKECCQRIVERLANKFAEEKNFRGRGCWMEAIDIVKEEGGLE